MKREEQILKRLTEQEGGLFYDTALRAMREFAKKQPLPPAEGAEEILDKHSRYHPVTNLVYREDVLSAMNEFATLHAQKIADKMVEWISVKDKLPEEHEDVLCYNGYRISSHNWCKHTDQDDDWFKKTFTHWCKLPNTPKP